MTVDATLADDLAFGDSRRRNQDSFGRARDPLFSRGPTEAREGEHLLFDLNIVAAKKAVKVLVG